MDIRDELKRLNTVEEMESVPEVQINNEEQFRKVSKDLQDPRFRRSMYKYLGTVFDDKLQQRFEANTEVIIKKCQQRQYFLRKLHSFGQTLGKAHTILQDPAHVLHRAFEKLPSGRRLRCPAARTNRRKETFMHEAVRLLNSSLPHAPSSSLSWV
ncbi:hypothetical protein SKAU_G00063750 [Synaphobranchus kaupii]|uniref:Alkylated DNA repair protein AlkB homologue 8 N-terminal domain-containing protein n=1 Tax=Synaphobranchus kaupii TaxID=118154 RepID=A0A9Q1JB01_SYNKA|nr:hypothetical protein SKAU_G00063750 [Synaphobranchus kaupii]